MIRSLLFVVCYSILVFLAFYLVLFLARPSLPMTARSFYAGFAGVVFLVWGIVLFFKR